MADPSPERVRFGDLEINLRTRELTRNGETIDLQEQPFLVLKALLEHPGELITREELIKRLWPADTFVDFEHSLNKAIKRLREALGDSADEPRYVQTLPRRGYRFIGEVVHDHQTRTTQTIPSSGSSYSASLRRWLIFGVAVVAIAAVVFGLLNRRSSIVSPASPVTPVRSLVVLPLENLSGDATQDYFTDGITDALITDLGQMGGLRVISRTSAMQYKGAHKKLPEIALELKVDMVVEGTVVRSGNRVRVTAQLIQASTDHHLWAQTYERDVRDVLSVQSEVARAIAGQIQINLTPQQLRGLGSPRAVSPEAQDAYLRGHYFAAQGTIDDLQKSIQYFEQSVEKEPSAAAYAGWASAYVSLGHMIYLRPQEAFPTAKSAALKALELDSSLEEAHTALGNVKFLYDWDFPGAEKEFELAIQLNPNSVRAQNAYADFLNASGHPNEAVARAEQSLQIDPLSLASVTAFGWQLYFARRYNEAIAQVRKVVEIDPNYFPAHVCLGLALEQKGDFASAIAELQKATGFCRVKCFGLIGQVSALSGDKQGALQAVAELQKRAYVSPWLVAIIYAELQDKERAFAWLDKAYEGREHDMAFIQVWPMFDSLHTDARYQKLLRRIGLKK